MKGHASRTLAALAAISVALFLVVGGVAVASGPAEARLLLLACALLSVLIALQAVTTGPRDLALALLLGILPVMALAAADAPSVLVVALGVLLLLACELNALFWRMGGHRGGPMGRRARARTGGGASAPDSALFRQRLVDVGRLTLLGTVGAAVALAAGSLSLPATTLAVALAALALAGAGATVFGRGTGM